MFKCVHRLHFRLPFRHFWMTRLPIAIQKAAAGPLKGVLDVVDAPLVSSDFNHDPHSSIFHADQTLIMGGDMVRVLSWYDNEWAFSNRMADTAVAMGKLI